MAEAKKFTRTELELSAGNVLRSMQKPAIGVGGLALVASFAGALVWPKAFFEGWLIAFLFWLGAALGSTGILMLQYISGGRWGAAIRRPLEAAASNVPMMALCFVPVALGIGHLYEWSDPEMVAHSSALQHKAVYLNTPFFIARAAFFFGVWILLSKKLVGWSREQDAQGHDQKRADSTSVLSHAGMIAYALTMSLAGIDWGMSLESHWFSHIYGLMFTGCQILTAMTVAVMTASRMADHRPISVVLSPDRFQDLGKLLLAFTMVWTYFQLSQYLIMWSANMPEEVGWYLVRNANGWQHVTYFLFAFHFLVPFGLLLSRNRKRDPRKIAGVAALLCFMQYVDVYWWISPSLNKEAFFLHPLHITTALGIGGVWVWAYIGNLAAHPIVAFNDPVIVTELEKA